MSDSEYDSDDSVGCLAYCIECEYKIPYFSTNFRYIMTWENTENPISVECCSDCWVKRGMDINRPSCSQYEFYPYLQRGRLTIPQNPNSQVVP